MIATSVQAHEYNLHGSIFTTKRKLNLISKKLLFCISFRLFFKRKLLEMIEKFRS